MAIPAFGQHGLLPAGVHSCTLDEIDAMLCWNAHRQKMWQAARAFIEVTLVAVDLSNPILIDGSFVRDKAMPADIDVCVNMDNEPQPVLAELMRMRLLDGGKIKEQYGIDFNVRHSSLPYDLASYFQYAGIKAAAELSIHPQHPKGILSVWLPRALKASVLTP